MTTQVRVICDDSRHPTKRPIIATFRRDGDAWFGNDQVGGLVGDDRADDRRHSAITTDDVEHETHALRCPLPLCGFELRAKGGRLDPILDTLATAGIGDISLRALAARVQ